jgi:hypothetical protein
MMLLSAKSISLDSHFKVRLFDWYYFLTPANFFLDK